MYWNSSPYLLFTQETTNFHLMCKKNRQLYCKKEKDFWRMRKLISHIAQRRSSV
jgi:hypothetical protein